MSTASQTLSSGPTVVTLTASIATSSSPVIYGTVDFFEATKLLGTAQVVQSTIAGFPLGTAVLKRPLGPGTHVVQAKFRGFTGYAASASATQTVSVAGTTPDTSLLYVSASYSLSDVTTGVTIADVNGDGLPDILVPLLDSGKVQIYLNDSTNPGHYLSGTTLVMPFNLPPLKIVVGDLNGDGLPDVVVSVNGSQSGYSDYFGGEIAVFLQNSSSPGLFRTGTNLFDFDILPNDIALADLNGDGLLDIVFAGNYYDLLKTFTSGYGVAVYTQSATSPGSFAGLPAVIDIESGSFLYLGVADMDADGLNDIVLGAADFIDASSPIRIYYSNSANPGTFSRYADFAGPANVNQMQVADIDGNGTPDVVFAATTSNLQVMLNNPSSRGNLLPPSSYSVFGTAVGLGLGDIVGNKRVDAVTGTNLNSISLQPANGAGGYSPPLAYAAGSAPSETEHVAAADLDGDGFDDVVATQASGVGTANQSIQMVVFTHVPSAQKQTPALQLNCSPGTASLGQSVALSAALSSPLGVPTGTVSFTDGSQQLGSAAVPTSGSVTLTTATLPAGNQTINLNYSGDATFAPANATCSVYVFGLTPTVTVSANPSSAPAGTAIPVTVKISGSGPTPTGVAPFYEYSNGFDIKLASVPLDATGTAVYSVGTLAPGTYEIEVIYLGDSVYGDASGYTHITVTPGATIALSASTTVINPTGPVTFTATVSNTSPLVGLPVSFFDYTTAVYSTTTDANGVATWQSPALSPGGHGITAQYLPANTGGDAVSNEIFYSISAANTTTTLTSSPNPPIVGTTAAFTAIVTAIGSTTVPSGTVSFTEDGVSIGSAMLDSKGTASIVSPIQAAGNHMVVASFGATTDINASSYTLTFTAAPPDFAINLDKSSLSLAGGTSGTVTVTLNPSSGFSDSVALSCASLPATLTCGFSSSPVTLSGASTTQVILTITAATHAQLLPLWLGNGVASLAGIAVILLWKCGRRRRLFTTLANAALLAGVAQMLTACGGSGSSSKSTYTPVTSTISVVGSAIVEKTSHSAYLTVTIQ